MPEYRAYLIGREHTGYRIPDTFSTKNVQGLLTVQVWRDGEADIIVAEFLDSGTAELRAPEARSVLNLTNKPRVVLVADQRNARGPWWPTTVFARLERLAAIVGVLLALVNYGDLLFAAPDFTLRAPASYNVLAGTQAEFRMDLFNRGDVSTRIDVETSFPATVTPPLFSIEPQKDQQITIRSSNGISVGETINLQTRGRAGRLRRALLARTSVTLVPWPVIGKGEQDLARVYQNGRSAEIRVPFRFGESAPRGLSCSATIVHAPGVTIEGARPSAGIGLPASNQEPGNELANLTWTMTGIDAFSLVDALIYLESVTPMTPSQWRTSLKGLQVECHRRTSS